MERKKLYKILLLIIIILSWVLLFSGLITVPPFIWLVLVMVTFLFYIGVANYAIRGRQGAALQEVVNDMEGYMERRAQERLREPENDESLDEDDLDEDLGEDIKIIKK